MVEITNIQVLEKILEYKASETSKFPNMKVNYFSQYSQFLNHLRNHIYGEVSAGLSGLSDTPGVYTAHDSSHFDEVVRYAGNLLGACDSNIEKWNILEPYELYVLLVAIRIHDVGNIVGREKHESECYPFLVKHEVLLGKDRAELKMIADIAKAHGGKVGDDKDTIKFLAREKYFKNNSIRPRLIAAIVRFADEVCELRGREATYLKEAGKLPRHNEIFHFYAASVNSAIYSFEDKWLTLEYVISISNVIREFGCDKRIGVNGEEIHAVYLIDEIYDRLEKMDRERRYCNNYTRGVFVVESIRATIEIVGSEDHEQYDLIPVPNFVDEGYPEQCGQKLREKMGESSGCSLAKKYAAIHQGVSNGN